MAWRTSGLREKAIYRFQKGERGRMGDSWAGRRLKIGSLLTPIKQSGDCFYDYQVIEKVEGGYRKTKTKVGAYVFGILHEEQPTEEEWHLLMGGATVAFSEKIDVQKEMCALERAARSELLGTVDIAVARMRASEVETE